MSCAIKLHLMEPSREFGVLFKEGLSVRLRIGRVLIDKDGHAMEIIYLANR